MPRYKIIIGMTENVEINVGLPKNIRRYDEKSFRC